MIRRVDVESMLTTLPNYLIEKVIVKKINAVRKCVERKFHLGLTENGSKFLFSLNAEEYSSLEAVDWDDGVMGRARTEELQTIGLEIMKRFGFDENYSKLEYTNRGFDKNGIVHDVGDRTAREYRVYPSRTIDGLAFERVRQFETTTGKTISVGWSAVDDGPLFKVRLGKAKK
jgi:hypothetical protein